jgi:hypothetical protein
VPVLAFRWGPAESIRLTLSAHSESVRFAGTMFAFDGTGVWVEKVYPHSGECVRLDVIWQSRGADCVPESN